MWLSQSSDRAAWLQLPVAAIVWLKGWIVARYFLESYLAHPFVAGVVRIFILCIPIALLLTAWLGDRFAQLEQVQRHVGHSNAVHPLVESAMRFVREFPFPILIVVAVLMLGTPFVPEPHLLEKARMAANGTLPPYRPL